MPVSNWKQLYADAPTTVQLSVAVPHVCAPVRDVAYCTYTTAVAGTATDEAAVDDDNDDTDDDALLIGHDGICVALVEYA